MLNKKCVNRIIWGQKCLHPRKGEFLDWIKAMKQCVFQLYCIQVGLVEKVSLALVQSYFHIGIQLVI